MALWVCGGEAGCGTKYALRLSRCPRCHNKNFHEEGPMPKISRQRGATNAGAAAPPTPATAPAAAGAVRERKVRPKPSTDGVWKEWEADDSPVATPATAEHAPEGGEPSWPGNSSSPSTAPQKTTSKQTTTPRRKQARSGNPSTPDPEASSSPASPAISGPETANPSRQAEGL